MNQKDFKDKSELQIFLSYFKPHRKLFFLDMVCALAIAMIDLAFPFISRWCMYKLLPDNAWRTFWTVMAVVFYNEKFKKVENSLHICVDFR